MDISHVCESTVRRQSVNKSNRITKDNLSKLKKSMKSKQLPRKLNLRNTALGCDEDISEPVKLFPKRKLARTKVRSKLVITDKATMAEKPKKVARKGNKHVAIKSIRTDPSKQQMNGDTIKEIPAMKIKLKVNSEGPLAAGNTAYKKVDESVDQAQRKREITQPTQSCKEHSNVEIDLSKEHVLQCISAIFHLTQEQLKSKNALFNGESHPVYLQLTCVRIPKTPQRQIRVVLPHSIVSTDDEIALFVCDLERGRRKDYGSTVEHYQELLEKQGCTNIKTVIPLNQVKTEYDQYELKRKLVSCYDRFLVDGRIAGHLSHLLGKHFYKKRKLPTPIRMQSKDLKHEIEHALKKTSIHLHSLGDTHILEIGNTSMTVEQVADNLISVCNVLSKIYPGGWQNIKSVRIKTATSIAIPVYMTLVNKNMVRVPVVKPQRPRAYRDVEGVLSTLSTAAKVTVKPDGDIVICKKRKLN